MPVESSLLDRYVEAFSARDVDALTELFHPEAWAEHFQVYGKPAIRRSFGELFQALPSNVRLARGYLGSRLVAYTEAPGRVGGMARTGYYWIEVRDGLIGTLFWEENPARASLARPA